MDDENHKKEDYPGREGTSTTTDVLAIQESADTNGADNLCQPIDDVVEGAGSNVEDSTIKVVEFWSSMGKRNLKTRTGRTPRVEPVGSEE
jgi:hypothetical protein